MRFHLSCLCHITYPPYKSFVNSRSLDKGRERADSGSMVGRYDLNMTSKASHDRLDPNPSMRLDPIQDKACPTMKLKLFNTKAVSALIQSYQTALIDIMDAGLDSFVEVIEVYFVDNIMRQVH
jgi:hypothetical protein